MSNKNRALTIVVAAVAAVTLNTGAAHACGLEFGRWFEGLGPSALSTVDETTDPGGEDD